MYFFVVLVCVLNELLHKGGLLLHRFIIIGILPKFPGLPDAIRISVLKHIFALLI